MKHPLRSYTKEENRAFQQWIKLKRLDLKHWNKYGFRKPSPYKLKIDVAETECFRLHLGTEMKNFIFND